MPEITLEPLEKSDREQFIKDNQYAFLYGATQEFGMRDSHFEEDGEIISAETIEKSIDGKNAETYRIIYNGEKVGGAVISVDSANHKGELELLFISPDKHSKGIGCAAWQAIENLHPEVKVWETFTPYFEKRNIHFYVNCCGFQIVEFYCSHNKLSDMPAEEGNDEMFRFIKRI